MLTFVFLYLSGNLSRSPKMFQNSIQSKFNVKSTKNCKNLQGKRNRSCITTENLDPFLGELGFCFSSLLGVWVALLEAFGNTPRSNDDEGFSSDAVNDPPRSK